MGASEPREREKRWRGGWGGKLGATSLKKIFVWKDGFFGKGRGTFPSQTFF